MAIECAQKKRLVSNIPESFHSSVNHELFSKESAAKSVFNIYWTHQKYKLQSGGVYNFFFLSATKKNQQTQNASTSPHSQLTHISQLSLRKCLNKRATLLPILLFKYEQF